MVCDPFNKHLLHLKGLRKKKRPGMPGVLLIAAFLHAPMHPSYVRSRVALSCCRSARPGQYHRLIHRCLRTATFAVSLPYGAAELSLFILTLSVAAMRLP